MQNSALSELSDKILNVAMIIETVKDANLENNSASAYVLEIALEEQMKIFNKVESMF